MDLGDQWPPHKKLVMEELIRGRDFASKLQNMLQKSDHDGSSSVSSAQQLVMSILRSFSDTLSALSPAGDDHPDEVVHQISAGGYVGSACSVDRASECSGESRKIPAAGGKDGRGCYKRRKKTDSRIIVAPIIDDEYAWRKYGQKQILNAKFPRCYFRCTHKYDQGCKAVKQVQKKEDESNMYHITYFGHHTCKTTLKAAHIFEEPLNSYLLSFDQSKELVDTRARAPNNINITTGRKRSINIPTPMAPHLVKLGECRDPPKQEESDEPELEQSDDDDISCVDSNLWKEIIGLGSSEPSTITMGFQDHVVSGVQYSDGSSHGFVDMEYLLKSVDHQFDGEFPFGEME